MKTYQLIVKGIGRVTFPEKCGGNVGKLIKALLTKEPSERLPMRPGGTNNIKEHGWYSSASFDWDAMKNLTMTVPYKPVVKGPKDKSQFNARQEDLPPHLEYKDDKSGWDKDFATT